MKTCLECGNIYNRESILKNHDVCPIDDCFGHIVDIDDDIFESVRLLNCKGFTTQYSCAGHTWGGNPYILFYPEVHIKTFSSLPKGFKTELSKDGRLNLSKKINSEFPIEILKAVMESSVDLLDWTQTLPLPKFLSIEFMIKEGVDPSNIQKLVENKLHLFSPDWIHSDEVFAVARYGIIICPSIVKDFKKEINSFVKDNGVKVSFK